jgi:hypothetical protein
MESLLVEGGFGLGNLWIIGWYIYSLVGTYLCMFYGAGLMGLFAALQKNDVPAAIDNTIDLCYGKLAMYY